MFQIEVKPGKLDLCINMDLNKHNPSLFQLEQMYLRSALSTSFDRVEVEAFSKGSIIVDYYVVFKELVQTVTTQDLKDTVEIETRQRNNDHMLGPLKIDAKHSDFIGK